jgi:hypothetical protein
LTGIFQKEAKAQKAAMMADLKARDNVVTDYSELAKQRLAESKAKYGDGGNWGGGGFGKYQSNLMDNNSDFVSYYRVQGGTPPKASKELISVDKSGNIKIKEDTLNVSKGSREHAEYFSKNLRPGSEIVEFKIPKWLDEFIEDNAIPQLGYKTNLKNQNGLAPKIVDPTTPGTSYELPSIWSKWLEENAVSGSGRVTKN